MFTSHSVSGSCPTNEPAFKRSHYLGLAFSFHFLFMGPSLVQTSRCSTLSGTVLFRKSFLFGTQLPAHLQL